MAASRTADNRLFNACAAAIGMHDETFHFEIFKKYHGNFEIFQDHFFEIFHEIS